MKLKSSNPPDLNLERAVEWLVQVSEAPTSAQLRRDLEMWLAADPDHERAWRQARKAWALIGETALPRAEKDESGSRSRAGLNARRWILGGMVGALAACLLLMISPSILIRLQADYRTATAETMRIILGDGTAVHLAPESAVRARIAPAERRIELLAGTAYFEVARVREIPFVVVAGEVSAKVLGTAFEVKVTDQSTSVTVREGAVGVHLARHDAKRLGPGDRVVVDSLSHTIRDERVSRGDIAEWRQGSLFVENARIADVVAELRHYQPGWIFLQDSALAEYRVTGTYDLSDPQRALRALVLPAGGHVRQVTAFATILTGP